MRARWQDRENPQVGARSSIVDQRAQERRRVRKTRETRESRNKDALARVESSGQNKLKKSQESENLQA